MNIRPESEFYELLREINRMRTEDKGSKKLNDKEFILNHYFQSNHQLLVYGTLAPGEPNEHLLRNIGGAWTQGVYVFGYYYSRGWGSTQGFPAFRWDPEISPVKVQRFYSARLEAHWGRLDAFESGYRRILVPVYDSGGFVSVANIYEALP